MTTGHPTIYVYSNEVSAALDGTKDASQQMDVLESLWPWLYEPNGYEPIFEDSTVSSPSSSYNQARIDVQSYNIQDFVDLRQRTDHLSALDEDQKLSVFGIETSATGASKKMRRKEQNRASQRAYRDRQRGKIAELQLKVVALKTQNEKLQARNDILEAAFSRDKAQSGHRQT